MPQATSQLPAGRCRRRSRRFPGCGRGRVGRDAHRAACMRAQLCLRASCRIRLFVRAPQVGMRAQRSHLGRHHAREPPRPVLRVGQDVRRAFEQGGAVRLYIKSWRPMLSPRGRCGRERQRPVDRAAARIRHGDQRRIADLRSQARPAPLPRDPRYQRHGTMRDRARWRRLRSRAGAWLQ